MAMVEWGWDGRGGECRGFWARSAASAFVKNFNDLGSTCWQSSGNNKPNVSAGKHFMMFFFSARVSVFVGGASALAACCPWTALLVPHCCEPH